MEMKTYAGGKLRARLPWLALVVLFAASLVSKTWFVPLLGAVSFPMSDEHFFIETAKSIFYTHTFLNPVFQSLFNMYYQVLFPLVIAPAYFFYSAEGIIPLLRTICCVLMSLAIFPAYLLSLQVLKNPWLAVVGAFLAVLVPEMALVYTISQETLFYPLFLLSLYLVYLDLQGRGSPWLLGVLFALLFLTRIVGISVPVVYFLLIIPRLWLTPRTERRGAIRRYLIVLLTMLVLVAASVVLIRLINYGSLAGPADTYSGSLSMLARFSKRQLLGSFLFGVGFNLFFFLLGVFFAPVLVPLENWRSFDRRNRWFLLFISAGLLFNIAEATYMFLLEGGSGANGIRVHFRYYFFWMFPFLLMLLAALRNSRRASLIGVSLIALGSIYVLLLQPHILYGSIIDSKSLLYYLTLDNSAVGFGYGLLVALVLYLLLAHGRRAWLGWIGMVLLAASLAFMHVQGQIKTIWYYTGETRALERAAEYSALAHWLEAHPGDPVIVPPRTFWMDLLMTTQSDKIFYLIGEAQGPFDFEIPAAANQSAFILPGESWMEPAAMSDETPNNRFLYIYRPKKPSAGSLNARWVLNDAVGGRWTGENTRLLIQPQGKELTTKLRLSLHSQPEESAVALLQDGTGAISRYVLKPEAQEIEIEVARNPDQPYFQVNFLVDSQKMTSEQGFASGKTYRIARIEVP